MGMQASVAVGDEAPDFTLTSNAGETVRLSDFRGKENVLLVFFPKAFTGICTNEMCEIRDQLGAYQAQGAQSLAVSCDTDATLKAFAEAEGLTFPLLSDFWPHGQTARDYGVFLDAAGIAVRATFLIDKAGVVRWSVVNSPGEARSTSDYHEALAALNA